MRFLASNENLFPVTGYRFPMPGNNFPDTQNKFSMTGNKFPVSENKFPVTRNIHSFTGKMSCAVTGDKFPVTRNKIPVTRMIFLLRENRFLLNFWSSFRCITFSRQMCGIYNQNFV